MGDARSFVLQQKMDARKKERLIRSRLLAKAGVTGDKPNRTPSAALRARLGLHDNAPPTGFGPNEDGRFLTRRQQREGRKG